MTDILERLENCQLEEPLMSLIEDVANEIKRLKDKCDKQAMILRRLTPEKHPHTMFISGIAGNKDDNGMPEKLLVCRAFGLDFSYIYEYTGKTTGPEW